MQGRIGTPRPPSFGARQQFRRRGTPAVSRRHRPQQSDVGGRESVGFAQLAHRDVLRGPFADPRQRPQLRNRLFEARAPAEDRRIGGNGLRSEEHTSELQSQSNLVCRLLLEKKNKNRYPPLDDKKKKKKKS